MMQKSWVQRAQRVMFGGRLAPIGVDELNHGLESARDDSTSQSEQQIVLHLSRATGAFYGLHPTLPALMTTHVQAMDNVFQRQLA